MSEAVSFARCASRCCVRGAQQALVLPRPQLKMESCRPSRASQSKLVQDAVEANWYIAHCNTMANRVQHLRSALIHTHTHTLRQAALTAPESERTTGMRDLGDRCFCLSILPPPLLSRGVGRVTRMGNHTKRRADGCTTGEPSSLPLISSYISQVATSVLDINDRLACLINR